MELAPGLTKHHIVVCVEKRERGLPLQTILAKMGYQATIVASLAEALKEIPQEMPHLVVSEAILSDGNAGILYDRLRQNEVLKKLPILVMAIRKSKQEIIPLKGRSFAGILLGALEPKTFALKVKQAFAASGNQSPYAISTNELNVDPCCLLSLPVEVLGKSNDQLVAKSTMEVDGAASLVLAPNSKRYEAALIKNGTNLKSGDTIYNLFPLTRIKGKGRIWINELPEFDVNDSGDSGSDQNRRVLFYDPSKERFQQFKTILSGYGIELTYAASLQQAAAVIKRDPAAFGCVYLFELGSDSSGMTWRKIYGEIPDDQKPVTLIGTSSLNSRSSDKQRYIKKPFGMGVLIEALEASFSKPADIAKHAGVKGAHIECKFQAPARLLSLDETGGVFQVKFPVLNGSKIDLNHNTLQHAWGDGGANVSITGAAPLPDKPDVWHVRFTSVAAGTSKAKYLEKLKKNLEPHLKKGDSADASNEKAA